MSLFTTRLGTEADMSNEDAEALATKPLGRVAAAHLVEAGIGV